MRALLLLEVGGIALCAAAATLLRRALRGPRRPGWSLRLELAQSVLRAVLMRSKRRGVRWLRAAQQALPVSVPLAGEVTFEPVTLGGVPCEWCLPRGRSPARTIAYLLGGGFVIGSLAGYRDLLSRLALGADARVLGVDYRLAPEHPFPAQQQDCLAATRAVLAAGADPARSRSRRAARATRAICCPRRPP